MKFALLAYLLSAASTFAADLGFSQMENGDRVEVTKHSTGCFHNTTSYYEVEKANGSHFFREYAITWDKSKPAKILQKRANGEIILGTKEIQGLDRLLQFYRAKKDVFSTTQVSLLVEYFEPGGRVGLEKLTDGSGGYGLGDKQEIVTFFALARRLRNKNVKQDDTEQATTAPVSKPEGDVKIQPESEGSSR